MLQSLEEQVVDGDLKGVVEIEEALDAEEEDLITIEEYGSEEELEGSMIWKFDFGG